MSDIKPLFSGEMQLAGWSQTHTSGNKITFWLADEEGLEPFKLLTARKGNHAGHRFAVVMVEIGDDELPVNHNEDVLDMVDQHSSKTPELGDETHYRSPNHPAFSMVGQIVDANKTIKIAQSDLVKWAGVLSSDRRFWEYVGTMHPVTPTNAGEAANYIRRECGITSRSELAHDLRAASHFRGVMKAFVDWKGA